MNLESPIIRQGNECTGNYTNKLLIAASFSPLSIWQFGLDRPRSCAGDALAQWLALLWLTCPGKRSGLCLVVGCFICAGDLEIPADPYRSGQSSASLAVNGRRDLRYWQVPSVLVHNTQGKWLIPFCSSVSVTLLLKCLGDVGLSGSPGKRAVRTNPGGLGSDSHCRVLEHCLFHDYPFLEKTTNLPSLCPA